MSTSLTTAERVLAVLEQIAETDEVRRNPDVELFAEDIIDSLGTVQLMVYLSEEFQVEISPAEIEREEWSTPRKIVEYMERRVRS
jgi:D-alanine--poly(phosphoribitol) ligase subunit 2